MTYLKRWVMLWMSGSAGNDAKKTCLLLVHQGTSPIQRSHSAGPLSRNTSSRNTDRIIRQKRPVSISHPGDTRPACTGSENARMRSVHVALDSKLRGCELAKLNVSDVAQCSSVPDCATIL